MTKILEKNIYDCTNEKYSTTWEKTFDVHSGSSKAKYEFSDQVRLSLMVISQVIGPHCLYYMLSLLRFIFLRLIKISLLSAFFLDIYK